MKTDLLNLEKQEIAVMAEINTIILNTIKVNNTSDTIMDNLLKLNQIKQTAIQALAVLKLET